MFGVECDKLLDLIRKTRQEQSQFPPDYQQAVRDLEDILVRLSRRWHAANPDPTHLSGRGCPH